MKTLVMATQKGGSGKTTLARILAVEAAREGARVGLLDLDPQGSLTRWWRLREADDLQMVEGIDTTAKIAAVVKQLDAQGFDYLLIDTQGARNDAARTALGLASLAIVPVHPSPDDLAAVGPTVSELREASCPFLFVLSRSGRSRLTDETIRVAAANGRLAPVNITARVAYAEAAAYGKSGAEMGKGPAADESARLWAYVKEQCQ